ncbi:MAG: ABC transporter permease [Melioribacteraceae bacterium]|jgi:putative ABC transport system permease protein|nr:ABC transporter permease [Melioribacteraceae bacterium]RJP62184.1 MAG: FtsX-like permease family protein [Ignavibacteriales bacterium]WKZ71210.1 MAG: ABC transporter permease [Melioribacteraceae bacterium]
MLIFEIIKVALNSLKANKLRSSLTVLGIVVGIFSIISISTVIAMLQTSIEDGVSALGKNTFQIQKWPAVGTGTENWAEIRNRKNINLNDYYVLQDKLGHLASIGAEDWQGGKLLKRGNKKTNPNISMCGVTPEAFSNNDWVVTAGRIINQRDLESSARVIVLGEDIKNTLFEPYEEPLGEEIYVDGNRLKVIGVLDNRDKGMFGRNEGNYSFVPITFTQSHYGSENRSLNLTVAVYDPDDYEDTQMQAEGIMRTLRKVPPGADRDFDIYSNESVLSQINEMTEGIKIGAYVIGLIALLAAGVGIMNIMLVSVTERTKEIGVRKAIGARKVNILIQFISEAIVLCLGGGIVGIILGIAVGNFAGSLLNATAVIPMDWVLVGVFLCVMIGIIFGTYPAIKASNLDPIEALRYE